MYITNEEYGEGFALEEYKGIFSITIKQEGRDGKEYIRWCKVEIGKDKTQQTIPLGVRLGDRDTAIAAVENILTELKAKATPEKDAEPSDDIPF